MAIKKIKLPNNTTEDINDPRLPAVTTTDNGKVLSVSGGIWSANSKPSYTLDEVTDGSTRKLANYLPLTGGTISNANFGGQLTIDRSSSPAADSVIKYTSAGQTNGYIGVRADLTPVFYSGTDTSGTGYTVYHSGNSNKSDVAWACSDLTASGKIYAIGGVMRVDQGYDYGTLYNGYHFALAGMDSTGKNMFGRGSTSHGVRPTQLFGDTFTFFNKNVTNVGSLDNSGNLAVSGTVTPGSDARIKNNQKKISKEDAYSVLERLLPKTWVWNEKAGEDKHGKTCAGLVAQEVEEILPDAVVVSECGAFKDFHSLNYNMVQGYEIAAIKGLIEEVKSLRAEVAELKKQIK